MPPLTDLQHAIAHALLDREAPVPPGIAPGQAGRFAVHRRNVTVGLLHVLEAHFPATRRLVGEEFFRAMAVQLIATSPPTSPMLPLYGSAFPELVAGFAPAAHLTYLADVARLEWLQLESYHAADAVPLDAEALAGIDLRRLSGVSFQLHPSLRLFASEHPAVTIWRLNADTDADVSSVKLADAAEWALVLRPHLQVEVSRVSEPVHDLSRRLMAGESLGPAAAATASRHPHLDVQGALAGLIEAGAIIGYDYAA